MKAAETASLLTTWWPPHLSLSDEVALLVTQSTVPVHSLPAPIHSQTGRGEHLLRSILPAFTLPLKRQNWACYAVWKMHSAKKSKPFLLLPLKELISVWGRRRSMRHVQIKRFYTCTLRASRPPHKNDCAHKLAVHNGVFVVACLSCLIHIMQYFNYMHNYLPFRLKSSFAGERVPFTSSWMRVLFALGN